MAGTLLMAPAVAQPRPEFEVASLKPGVPLTGDRININLGAIRNGTVTLTNASLSDCLQFAYDITSNTQIAGPDWIRDKTVRFDIVAKAPPETPRSVLLVMTQNLLTNRFQLKFHREPRELSHYVLTVAKGGHKMTEVTGPAGANTNGPGRIQHTKMSMALLGTLLSRFELRLPVIDQTGLTGFYEVKLEWAPERPNAPPDPEPSPFPSLYRAVQDQLGLRLESRKGPVEVLVIDHTERVPLGN